MNIVDYILIGIIVLWTISGYKNGVIRSLATLVVIVIASIVAYYLKTPVATFLMQSLPFFNFAGAFENILGINILFYNGVAFIFIFVIIYSILNILVVVAGFLDKILRATVILYVPDKVLGAMVGFIQGVMIAFLFAFTLLQMPNWHAYAYDSALAYKMINRTPVIRTVLAGTTEIIGEINTIIEETDTTSEAELKNAQIKILNTFVSHKLVDASIINDLVDNEKINLTDIQFQ